MNEYTTFGEYVKSKRELLGKSIRGVAPDLEFTPMYLSQIENNQRSAPEKHLDKIISVLKIPQDELHLFYDLVGKSRKNVYPDLDEYIGKTDIARVALRKARDLNISDEQWQKFINSMKGGNSK